MSKLMSRRHKTQDCLYGTRIILRPLSILDAKTAYVSWMNDADVVRYLESRFTTYTAKDIEEYIERCNGDPHVYLFGIFWRESEKHIGNIKLGPVNDYHHHGDIGLVIGEKEYWGKGVATEAIGLLSNYAFEKLGLNKVTAGAYQANIGSIKAFEKVGFDVEGIRRKQYMCSSEYVDGVLLGLLRE